MRWNRIGSTRRGWDGSDRAIKAIIEKDGVGNHLSWVGGQPTLTAHPLASCRMGDDPATSALTADHELRGSPGLFVTDGSAVPTSLTVNPSLTIAALAERASVAIARRAAEAGIAVRSGAPAPGSA
jgi:choline dehydrogenase-like flavoprotein